MNTAVLIEALVRQTTVLIATLATAAGERTPLARVANQVFADLVRELKQQGVGNKVIADMFGMALRTYHYRMARLAESATEQGRSIWEAVLGYVQQHGEVLRADVLKRFVHDDPEIVHSVLRDLVDARLLYRTGRGDFTGYRAAAEDAQPSDDDGAVRHLLLVMLHRHGAATREELAQHLPGLTATLDTLLQALVAEGRVRVVEHPTGAQGQATSAQRYACDTIVIDYGDSEGWQAALFDHYQAMVAAMCRKLPTGRTHAAADDRTGGSTYHFDIGPGHPLEQEVLGLLGELRARSLELCKRVQAHNDSVARHGPGLGTPITTRVTAYVGQAVFEDEEGHDHDDA